MSVLILCNYSGKYTNFPKENGYKTFFINYDPDNIYITQDSSFRLGYKWQNILWYLEHFSEWKSFDYIWMPNDDIVINENSIHEFLTTVTSNKFVISQPSYKSDVHSSFTRTLHVDNRAPCFHIEFVKNKLLPILIANKQYLESGYGIDSWWSKLSIPKYVVDKVYVDFYNNSSSSNKNKSKEEFIHFKKRYLLK